MNTQNNYQSSLFHQIQQSRSSQDSFYRNAHANSISNAQEEASLHDLNERRRIAISEQLQAGARDIKPTQQQVVTVPTYTKLVARQNYSGCSAAWNGLPGDHRVRWSASCNHSIYDASAMSEDELLSQIWFREGIRPVVLYKRKDGTVLSSHCQSAVQKVRLMQWTAVAVLGLVVIVWLFSMGSVKDSGSGVGTPVADSSARHASNFNGTDSKEVELNSSVQFDSVPQVPATPIHQYRPENAQMIQDVELSSKFAPAEASCSNFTSRMELPNQVGLELPRDAQYDRQNQLASSAPSNLSLFNHNNPNDEVVQSPSPAGSSTMDDDQFASNSRRSHIWEACSQ